MCRNKTENVDAHCARCAMYDIATIWPICFSMIERTVPRIETEVRLPPIFSTLENSWRVLVSVLNVLASSYPIAPRLQFVCVSKKNQCHCHVHMYDCPNGTILAQTLVENENDSAPRFFFHIPIQILDMVRVRDCLPEHLGHDCNTHNFECVSLELWVFVGCYVMNAWNYVINWITRECRHLLRPQVIHTLGRHIDPNQSSEREKK